MEGLCSVTGVLPGIGHNDVVPWERSTAPRPTGAALGGSRSPRTRREPRTRLGQVFPGKNAWCPGENHLLPVSNKPVIRFLVCVPY